MPRGIKDWLAGKNPADVTWERRGRRRDKKPSGVRAKQVSGTMANHDDSGRTLRQASLPDARDGTDAGTKERKRRDRQRALDRRAAATAPFPDDPRGGGGAAAAAVTAASSVSVPSDPLPGIDGICAGESKQTTEGLEDDDDGVAEGKGGTDTNSRATKQGQEPIAAGIARPVAAGNPWLALADIDYDSSGEGFDYYSMSGGESARDLLEVVAEPKSTISGGGVNEEHLPSWSFASSGLAPMADGEEWKMDDETDDDEEDHVDGR